MSYSDSTPPLTLLLSSLRSFFVASFLRLYFYNTAKKGCNGFDLSLFVYVSVYVCKQTKIIIKNCSFESIIAEESVGQKGSHCKTLNDRHRSVGQDSLVSKALDSQAERYWV
jgi:hypothetical protein